MKSLQEKTAKARENHRLGISFLEVVIAVCVLFVGIIPAFHVFFRGNFGTIMMRDEIMAQMYASELIDHLLAAGYEEATVGEAVEVPVIPGGKPLEARFSRRLSVKEKIPAGGCSDWPLQYKIIAVEIHWETSGNPQNFALTALLFRGRN